MRISFVFIVTILCLCSVATAGPFTDEISKCIVMKTTASDNTLFIQWIFAAMSSHPDVESMSNISPKMRDQLNKRAADMIMELLTVRCKEECKKAVKYEGSDSLKTSFELLGQVAMQGLMTHQKVGEYLSGLEKYYDSEKLKKTFAPE
jgi:hypothetical protein